MPAIKNEIRPCADIGMFAIDRKISVSCKGTQTDFCAEKCFNNKLFNVYPNMHGKDERNEVYFANLDGERFRKDMSRKRKFATNRFRMMTRGETFDTLRNVERMREIAASNPDTIFWIPTRGWRNPIIRLAIERDIMPLANVALNASLDPTNTRDEYESLVLAGWSTMFFGDDDVDAVSEKFGMDRNPFKCPKTWKGLKGHCGGTGDNGICKAGCFRNTIDGKRTDVHLSQH